MPKKKLPVWTKSRPGLQFYTCTVGGAFKYWAIIKIASTKFKTFWGRIGNEPQTSKKSFASRTVRDHKFAQIIQQKLDKGYKLEDTVSSSENPPLQFPSMGKGKIKPGKKHDTSRLPTMGNVLDVIELE